MFGRFSKCISAVLAACIIAANVPAPTANAQDDIPNFSYIGAAAAFSPEQTADMAKTVYEGLKEHKSEIKLQVDGVSMMIQPNHEVAAGICREVAQNYDVGLMVNATSIKYELYSNGTESYVSYAPDYVVDDSQYDSERESAMSVLDDIAAMVGKGWSDYEKALFLHDYLAAYCDYDHTLSKFTAYEMVTTGDAVCDGYSAMYSMLLNRLGVRSTKVISRTLNHAWNLVELGGEWYHVDVTFDDSFHYGHPGLVSHDFFLKTSDEMNANQHTASDYKFLCGTAAYDKVTATPVSGFWNDTTCAVSPIVIDSDPSNVMWAVINEEDDRKMSVGLYDMDSVRGTSVKYAELNSQSAVWNVPGSSAYYPGNHSAAFVRDNVLFYTTGDEIYGLYNGKAVSLYKLTDEQKSVGRIYGLFEKEGDIYYYVSRSYAPDQTYGKASATSQEYRLSGYTIDRLVEFVKNETGESAVTIMTNGEETDRLDGLTYSIFSPDDSFDRAGYLFKGLYYDEACSDDRKVGNALITRDRTLYADWYRCGIAGARASIADQISLSMYFGCDDVIMNGEGNYFEVSTESKDGISVDRVYFSDIADGEDIDIGGYNFADVTFPPKDMEKTVTVETFIDGVSRGVQTYCVNDYLNDIINSTDSRFDDFKDLASAALMYGACANAYFDKDSSGVTDEMRESLASADLEPPAGADFGADVEVNNVPDVVYVGSSLLLESSTTIRHRFGIAEGRNADEFTFAIDGESVSPISLDDTIERGGVKYSVYEVEITGIAANELMLKRRFELSDGTNTDVLDIGACGFAYQVAISTDELDENYRNLMKALIVYGKEAGKFA